MVLVKRPTLASPLSSDVPLGNYCQPQGGFSPSVDSARRGKNGNGIWTNTSAVTKITFVSVIIISWAFAFNAIGNTREAIRQLEIAQEIHRTEYNEALQLLADARKTRKTTQKRVDKLTRESQVLKHEVRVATEKEDWKRQRKPKPKKSKVKQQHDVMVEWLEERQEAIKGKVLDLQTYVQEESRRNTLERYGEGPHRVRFTVEFEKKQKGTFVVEMGSLDDTPHSIFYFLETVSNNIWDNTVFFHEAVADHVLMGVPFNFISKDFRRHHLKGLGLSELGFTEYSLNFPHEKYTLGFAGKGTDFFINTADNTQRHGPGGQRYHDFPEDADPCFAKVVEGKDVIDRLNLVTQNKENPTSVLINHKATHIVKVELV